MELTLITDANRKAFEDMIFMENHTLGIPVISAGIVEKGRPIAAGSMEIDGSTGRIISVYTEKEYQKKGEAGMLLDGFKELAASMELEVLEADFVAEEEGVEGLFSSRSYLIFDGTEISSISLDDALDSAQVKEYLNKAANDVQVVPFSKFTPARRKGMISLLDADVDNDALEGLSHDLSAFVLGQYNQPMGFILVRENESDIIIDALKVNEERDEYIAALFRHMYSVLIPEKGTGLRIGFVAMSDGMMDRVGEVIGYVMEIEGGMKLYHAVKLIG